MEVSILNSKGGFHVRTLIVFLALAASAYGAGTLTQVLQKQGQTDIVTITVTFTGDASDGSVPFTTMLRNGRDVQSTDGYSIVGVQTKPGATQPTANWDFALQNEDGLDLLADACINRSASAVQFCGTDPRPIHSAVSIRVTGNSVNSATGTITIFLTKTTVAKRGGTGGAVATGTYAYSGSVTTSGSPPSAVLTHNLALTDKRNFVPACYNSTDMVGVGDITPIDGNSVTITTATAATVYCTIISNGGTGGGGSHTHDASEITSGALAKARQHNQTHYSDQDNTASSDYVLDGALGAIKPPRRTVSGRGAASSHTNKWILVTDCESTSACSTGGGSNKLFMYSDGTNWIFPDRGAGSEGTVVANSGATGASVLKTSTNVTARKIKAGSNVTITENTDDIEIAASVTGSGNIPSGGTIGQTLRNSASGTASWTDFGRGIEYISDGNGTRFRVTSAAAPMPLVNTVTWDPTSISAGARATQTVTVTGAQQGDPCVVGIPPGVKSVGSGLTAECAFETANTATIYLENNSASSRDPAPTTAWTVIAVKSTWAVE